MEINTLRIAVTVSSFVAFLVIVAWAYAGRNKDRFDGLAGAVLADDEATSGGAQ